MINGTDVQNNLNLTNRAFMAATMNNAYLSFYYNVSNPNQTYMTSKLGDTYEVGFDSSTPLYWDRLHITQFFSDFLQIPDSQLNVTSSLTIVQPNPWNLTQDDFSGICMYTEDSKRAY